MNIYIHLKLTMLSIRIRFFSPFLREITELEQVYSIACVNWLLSCPEYIFHNTT